MSIILAQGPRSCPVWPSAVSQGAGKMQMEFSFYEEGNLLFTKEYQADFSKVTFVVFLLHWVFCGRTKVKSSKHCLEWEFRLIWEMICFSWKEIFLPGSVAMHRRQRLKSISPNTTLKSINPFNSNKFLLSTSLFQQSLLSAQIPLCTNHGIYLRHFPKDKNPL